MMFQSYALFPHLTRARQRRLRAEDARRRQGRAATPRAAAALELVAMDDYADRAPGRSSPAASSSAWRWPAPSSPSRRSCSSTSRCPRSTRSCASGCAPSCKRLQRELGITFVHVTHAQDEAMALADLVVVMNEGRIEQQGSPREVFNRPRTEFVARFIGGHNVIAADGGRLAVRADRLRADAGSAPAQRSPAGDGDGDGRRVPGRLRADLRWPPTTAPSSLPLAPEHAFDREPLESGDARRRRAGSADAAHPART